MTQTVTFVSTIALAGVVLWWLRERLLPRETMRVSVRLDRSTPGAHLIWDIVNLDPSPAVLTGFAITPRHVGEGRGESVAMVPLATAETLQPGDHAQLSMDVDWRLLTARSIAACDAAGRTHRAPAPQLDAVQAQLHELIDRRVYNASARDWLFGAANLAFGVVILGLGFFMLMWMIATG